MISNVKRDLYIVNGTWECCKCGEIKPLEHFGSRKGRGCKSCYLSEQAAKRELANREKKQAREAVWVATEKACKVCNIVKPISEFYQKKGVVNGIGMCKPCHVADCKARKEKVPAEIRKQKAKQYLDEVKNDPERYAAHKAKKQKWNYTDGYKDYYYKGRFGITLDEVRSMLNAQNGRCANIGCSKEIHLATETEKATAVVDHSHVSGKVRAMLCIRCNSMLGAIENNANLLPGFLDYLNKHKEI